MMNGFNSEYSSRFAGTKLECELHQPRTELQWVIDDDIDADLSVIKVLWDGGGVSSLKWMRGIAASLPP